MAAALVGGIIAWRPLQDSLSAYGPIGIHTLLLWQAATLIPVALALRWGWQLGLRMVWWFPLVWVGGEYLRILGPIGFPFCSLALPVYEQLWLIQLADLGGLHLVSGVLAMGSGLLLDVLRNATQGARFDWRGLRPSVVGFVGVMFLVLTYNAIRQRQIEGSLQPGPQVAVIQPDIPLTGNPESDYDGKLLLQDLKAMSEAAAQSSPPPQLIVWPEAIVDWPLHNPEYFELNYSETLFPKPVGEDAEVTPEVLAQRWDARRTELRREDAALRAWVAELGIPLLFGQVVTLPVEQNGTLVLEQYNAARFIRPQNDDPFERQLKIRLFPGGEYLPGGRERLQTLAGTSEYFSEFLDGIGNVQAGSERELFFLPPAGADATGAEPTPFIVSICGEILFPESSGVFEFRESSPLLLNIMNMGRFRRNRALLGTYMVLPFRAIEARRPIACSANTGISGFVAPTGRIYGQVTNGNGAYWTGLGYAEQSAIETFNAKAQAFADDPSNAALREELVELSADIRRLRKAAGVSGFSVERVELSEHGTLYQGIGNLFPQFALLVLIAGTVAAFVPRQDN